MGWGLKERGLNKCLAPKKGRGVFIRKGGLFERVGMFGTVGK